MNHNLFALIASCHPLDPHQCCIEAPGGRSLTWRDLERTTARIANLFASLGLPPGARVVSQVEKSPEALFLYLAVLRAGLVFVPLNPAYRESEAGYFLENAEPSAVVCRPDNFSWMRFLAGKICPGAHVFTLDDAGDGGTLLEAAARQPPAFSTAPRRSDDLALLIYTSGTTGRSKGAMLSHGNLAANALTLRDYWGWRSDDVILHALPIFHVHGLCVAAHGALLSGATMLWMPRFDPPEVLRQLPRATLFMGVPTFYTRLLAQEDLNAERCAGVRLFISGSAPLSVETFRAFQARTGHTILERYGMSETVMLTSNPYHPHHGPRVGGTIGRPLPGVSLRVMDERGEPCPPGEIGGIEVRGPNVCAGYWRAPEKTREDWTADGWFKTGDVGRFGGPAAGGHAAPEDYLSIVGRSKDLIITGGYNVYPKEVESFLDELPGVAESAVFGVPDADFGEAVTAAVVPRTGAALAGPDLVAALKGRIAGFKVPKRLHVIPELPRNAMGKVQKNVLRETFHP